MSQELPERVRHWLNNEGLSDEAINDAQLSWNGTQIVIPVFDKDKKFLFAKYRRDPLSTDGAKYMYDPGATATLYNTHAIKNCKEVIITEGEKDALVLTAHGFPAISSTGGSGTFNEEWADELIDKKVFICYDRDVAGYRGAFHAQGYMPWASIIWLPEGIKDASEYFGKFKKTAQDFLQLIATAKTYTVPLPLKVVPQKKKELDAIIKAHVLNAGAILKERQELKSLYKSDAHLEVLSEYLLNNIEKYKRIRKYIGKSFDSKNSDRLQAAKRVPIDKFIMFNRSRMANCIWHDETTPSMHYYPNQNRVKCFGGCGKMGDTIDVIMQMRKVKMNEAIEYILKN